MKKHTIFKRIISAMLSIALIAGIITVSRPDKVEAEDNIPEVSLEFIEIDGDWIFERSELDDDYEDLTYAFECYVDDSTVLETGWLELWDGEVFIWSPDGFPNETEPIKNFTIPAGTIFKECEYADPSELIDGGLQWKLEEEVRLVYEGGVWKKDDGSIIAPPDAPKVTIDFKEAYFNNDENKGWKFTFDRSPMQGTGYYKFATMIIDGVEYKGLRMEFPDWTKTSADEIYMYYQLFPDHKLPESSFVIPEGTAFLCEGDDTVYVTSARLEVTKNGENWESNHPVDSTGIYNELKITYAGTEGAGFHFDVEIVEGPDKGKHITDVYGNWSNPAPAGFLTFEKKDGYVETMNVLWSPHDATQIFISGDYQHYVNDLTKISIEKGAVITPLSQYYSQVPMRVTNAVTVEKEGEEWPVPEPPEIVVPPNTPEVVLDFEETYYNSDTNKGWVLNFDKDEMWATGFWKISSVLIDGKVAYNLKMECPDWTNQATRNWAYIYHNVFPSQKMPESSFVIPEGAVLVNENDGTMYVVGATLEVTKEGDEWKSNNPTIIPDVTNDIRITYDRFEGNGFYVKAEIVAGPDKGKNVMDLYGEWSANPPLGRVLYTRNGKEQKMNALWCTCNTNEIYIIGDYQAFMSELTTLEILKDTIIKPYDTTKCQTPMRVVNDLKLERYEEYKVWGPAGMITSTTKFNDVKLSFINFNGEGYYLKAEIVAGPDKGKNVADVYGEWIVPSPTGYVTLTENGMEADMNVLFSPCSTNQLYISGNYKHYVEQLTSLTIFENTLIIPAAKDKSTTIMRVVNRVDLAKEPVYGMWGNKGEVTTPTEFTDVVLDVNQVRGHALTLNAKLANGSSATLASIYGNTASVWGNIDLNDPDNGGQYTDKKAVYSIEDGKFKLYGILPATKESITIEAGTVLFAYDGCKTLMPIRIVNSVKLTRDAEDEWVYAVGDKVALASGAGSASGGTSPQTGDMSPFGFNIAMLAVSALVALGALYYERKRRMYEKNK